MHRFATVAALVLLATPAAAQTPPRPDCFPSPQLYGQLANSYGEARRSAGLAGQIVIELWTNADTGSWTILATRPDGVSCLAASGEGWADVPPGQPL